MLGRLGAQTSQVGASNALWLSTAYKLTPFNNRIKLCKKAVFEKRIAIVYFNCQAVRVETPQRISFEAPAFAKCHSLFPCRYVSF